METLLESSISVIQNDIYTYGPHSSANLSRHFNTAVPWLSSAPVAADRAVGLCYHTAFQMMGNYLSTAFHDRHSCPPAAATHPIISLRHTLQSLSDNEAAEPPHCHPPPIPFYSQRRGRRNPRPLPYVKSTLLVPLFAVSGATWLTTETALFLLSHSQLTPSEKVNG